MKITLKLSRAQEGLLFGLLGVIAFSMTLPATRLAVASLDPVIVGLGRAIIAACFAAPLLFFTRQPLPSRVQWRSLAIVAAGAIIGFPMLSAWSMRFVPATHGAVLVGLTPLATAIAGMLRAHEKPSFWFWLASAPGSIAVVIYALRAGGGELAPADFALLAAVVCVAMGYAEGARIARELGGWQTICWALLLSVPVLIAPVSYAMVRHGINATPAAWFGFAYVSVISMFLAFFAWYHALAVGGVARVSQLQLLQPFCSQAFAALILGEALRLDGVACVAIVAASIFFSRRSPIYSRVSAAKLS